MFQASGIFLIATLASIQYINTLDVSILIATDLLQQLRLERSSFPCIIPSATMLKVALKQDSKIWL